MPRKTPLPRKTARRKGRAPDSLLVSIPEFSRIAGLGESFTRRLTHNRTLPACVLAGRFWILRDQAIDWLRSQPEA